MTNIEKQLLLKDLCARLPYYVQCYSNVADHNWCILTPVVISNLFNATEDLVLKPYLRPISSMTEEEIEKCRIERGRDFAGECGCESDYLNSIHVDYRGLIEKGLALEAPEDMYKTE